MAIALSIAYTTSPLAAGVKLAVFATKQVSQGVFRPSPKAYSLIQVTAAAAASPIDVLATYTAKFGAQVSGRKIFFKLVPFSSTGVNGPSFETSQTIT